MDLKEDLHKIDSTYRNQQGNGDDAEKQCPNILVIFVVLCNDPTWVFVPLPFARCRFSTAIPPPHTHTHTHPTRDMANSNTKSMFSPYTGSIFNMMTSIQY